MSAVVEMLCGLTGSGKTMYALAQESQGAVRLSVDEEVHRRHGIYMVDFPQKLWPSYEEEARVSVENQLMALLPHDVKIVLDFGFWKRSNRERIKALIEAADARWELIYFRASREVLSERLSQRNHSTGANAVKITEPELDAFFERFEAPENEGEFIIEQQ